MEPCLFRHGKTRRSPFPSSVQGLQWSHVFSDMVRGTSGPTSVRRSEASMEPCLFRHGKRPHQIRAGAGVVASMEPCLFRHGKRMTTMITGRIPTTLQWSHVFSDMVSGRAGWGRRLMSDASMEPCLFRHGKVTLDPDIYNRIKGFNGAMSFQTW